MNRRSVIKRVTPDDEIVGNGHVHLERMSDGHVWINLCGFTFDIIAKGNRVIINPQEGDWPVAPFEEQRPAGGPLI